MPHSQADHMSSYEECDKIWTQFEWLIML